MVRRKHLRLFATTAALVLLGGASAEAARIRYRYAPVDTRGGVVLQPTTLSAPGERLNWCLKWEPYPHAPRPTQLVAFRHPCSGQILHVPLALPESPPRMEYRTRRVIYNYGSDTVEVHFLDDGALDVVYNSGLFRAP